MRRSLIAAAALAAATVAPAPASAFTARVTNPWFPLQPGMRWVYKGVKDGRHTRDVVRVAHRVAMIDGVPCAVVIDRVVADGKLSESTIDWYTQDSHGTVWYYGERTKELDRHGRVISREGSWRTGRHGARGGVFMPRHPRVGQSFAQEHFPGHAEDHFRVRRHFAGHILETREWTPLEPGVRDRKLYLFGVGQIAEDTLKGGNEHAHLVSFTRG